MLALGAGGVPLLAEDDCCCGAWFEPSSVALPGTSRLDRTGFRSFVGLVEIGNLVLSLPSVLLSLLCPLA